MLGTIKSSMLANFVKISKYVKFSLPTKSLFLWYPFIGIIKTKKIRTLTKAVLSIIVTLYRKSQNIFSLLWPTTCSLNGQSRTKLFLKICCFKTDLRFTIILEVARKKRHAENHNFDPFIKIIWTKKKTSNAQRETNVQKDVSNPNNDEWTGKLLYPEGLWPFSWWCNKKYLTQHNSVHCCQIGLSLPGHSNIITWCHLF